MLTPEQFLERFPKHLLMALDDKVATGAEPRRGKPKEWHTRIFKTLSPELHALNKDGAGIFFSPNQYPDGSRQGARCAGINAWYMEIDNISKEEQLVKIKLAPIYPSLMVETDKSYHCYWLAENGTVENFKKVARGLRDYFNSDPAVADIARVLRVPGFYHNKKEPFLVKVVLNSASVYREEDMLEAYPYVEKVYKPKKQNILDGADIWSIMSEWDNMALLDMLSGDRIVNGDTYAFKPRGGSGGFHIHVNGSPANAWIDVDGKIGGICAPTWIQWLNNVNYYNVSKVDILKWIKENCSNFLPTKFLEEKNKLLAKRVVGIQPKPELTQFKKWEDVRRQAMDELLMFDSSKMCKYHIPEVDKEMGGIFPAELIVVGADEGLGKSDFCLQVVKKNARAGKKILYYQLEMTEEEPVYREVYSELNRRSNFKISPVDFRMNKFTTAQKEILKEIMQERDLINENMYLYTGMVLDFDGFIKSLEEGLSLNPDLIVIDHLHYFSMDGENMSVQIGNIMRNLKLITKKYKIPIIVVSHFRKRDITKDPTSADLFGSSNIGKEANTTFFIVRDREDNETRLIAWKRRVGGKKIEFTLVYNPELGEYDLKFAPQNQSIF